MNHYIQENIEIGVYEADLHSARQPDCDRQELIATLKKRVESGLMTMKQCMYILLAYQKSHD